MLAQTRLKKILRSHPDIRQHVNNLARIDAMKKPELLALAEKLSINVHAINKEVRLKGSSLEASYDEDEIERMQFSDKSPGFSGQIIFNLVIELLGHRVKRKARIDYTHTPVWEYFDLTKRARWTGWESSHYGVEVLARSRRRRPSPEDDMWTNVGDLLEEGVLSDALFDHIWNLIDADARSQDRERRRLAAAGEPLPDPPKLTMPKRKAD